MGDMGVQFFLPFLNENGQAVTNNCDIATNYMSSWFWIDIISVIPYDIFTFGSELEKLSLLRMLRLFKLIKLLRVVRASRIVSRWRNRFGMSNAVMQLGRFMLTILLLAHWSACTWFMLADVAPTNVRTWLDEEDLVGAYPILQYLASLYFVVATLATIGCENGWCTRHTASPWQCQSVTLCSPGDSLRHAFSVPLFH